MSEEKPIVPEDMNILEIMFTDIDEETASAAFASEPTSVLLTLDDEPADVEARVDYGAVYSVRGPSDVMLSGPVTGGWGPGRWFATRSLAVDWAMDKYGLGRVVVPEAQSAGRWCLLVKGLKREA